MNMIMNFNLENLDVTSTNDVGRQIDTNVFIRCDKIALLRRTSLMWKSLAPASDQTKQAQFLMVK